MLMLCLLCLLSCSASRQPVKLTVQMPRYATLEQVTAKAIQVYNSYEAACSAGYTALHPGTAATTTGAVTSSGGTGSAPVTPIHRSSSRSQSLQQLAPSTPQGSRRDGPDEKVPAESAEDTPAAQPAPSAVVPATPAATERVQPPPPPVPLVPALVAVNTIVIDVNDKQKGRFGKMLDKR
jgi:hypothetical protein